MEYTRIQRGLFLCYSILGGCIVFPMQKKFNLKHERIVTSETFAIEIDALPLLDRHHHRLILYLTVGT
jgi:hypothetical protein